MKLVSGLAVYVGFEPTMNTSCSAVQAFAITCCASKHL